jgi:hypothetical protein
MQFDKLVGYLNIVHCFTWPQEISAELLGTLSEFPQLLLQLRKFAVLPILPRIASV